jgi:hypothetical protein
LNLRAEVIPFKALLPWTTVPILHAAVFGGGLHSARSLHTGGGGAHIAIIAGPIIGDVNTTTGRVAGVVRARISIITSHLFRALTQVSLLISVRVHLVSICDGGAVVDVRTDPISIPIFTTGQTISEKPAVTHTVKAPHRIFTTGILITICSSTLTFIDVFTGKAVSHKSLVTGAFIAALGIRTLSIVATRTCGERLYEASIPNTGAIQPLIARLSLSTRRAAIVPTGLRTV